MSLHNLTPATLSKAQQQRLLQLVSGTIKSRKTASHADTWNRWTDDEGSGSFFTARGTVRSVVPRLREDGLPGGAEDEVEQDVLVLVHDRGEQPASPCPSHSSEWSYGESPLPSRVLYLFHPPPTRTVRSRLAAGDLHVDPWAWLESARESLERAFWDLLMPSVGGIIGMSEKVSSGLASFITILPIPSNLAIEGSLAWQTTSSIKTAAEDTPRTWARDATYQFQASASLTGSPVSSLSGSREVKNTGKAVPDRLCDHDTIYTLQLPPGLPCPEQPPDLGIGPTLRPVYIRKRAGLPWTGHGDDGMAGLGLGREHLAMEVSGMRV
ncbi:hypothetical protein IAU60_005267 [Kwoniella sp. DSM 27419]